MLLALFWATPAEAQNGVVVLTTLGLPGLQSLCLTQNCTVVGALDGSLNELFLLTTPLDPQTLANVLVLLPGIVDAEVDQVLTLIGSANLVPALLSTTLLSNAQIQFRVTGNRIVADIVIRESNPHPALHVASFLGY